MSRGKNDDSALGQKNQVQDIAVVNPAAEHNPNTVVADGVGESVHFKDTFRTALATSEPPAVDGNPNRHSLPRITKNNQNND